MKFYELDNALQKAIHAADKPLRLKIEICFTGYFDSVFEQDILEANFYGLKEKPGEHRRGMKCYSIICMVSTHIPELAGFTSKGIFFYRRGFALLYPFYFLC